MLTYGGIRDIDACAMIGNRKHVLKFTTVNAYIWRHQGYRCMCDNQQLYACITVYDGTCLHMEGEGYQYMRDNDKPKHVLQYTKVNSYIWQ